MKINEQLIEIQEHFGVISSEVILITGSIILLILGILKTPFLRVKGVTALVLLGSFIYVPKEQGLFFTQTIICSKITLI